MPVPPEEPRRPADEPSARSSLPPPGSAEEALRRLEQRLDRATEAAERLMAEAEAAAGAGNPGGTGNPGGAGNPGGTGNPDEPIKPPPAGWQVPEDARAATPDLDPFVALLQAVRDLVPPELQRRLVAALRELLLALRAVIDWYLERLERRREQSVEVEDIPIL